MLSGVRGEWRVGRPGSSTPRGESKFECASSVPPDCHSFRVTSGGSNHHRTWYLGCKGKFLKLRRRVQICQLSLYARSWPLCSCAVLAISDAFHEVILKWHQTSDPQLLTVRLETTWITLCNVAGFSVEANIILSENKKENRKILIFTPYTNTNKFLTTMMVQFFVAAINSYALPFFRFELPAAENMPWTFFHAAHY